MQLLPQKNHSLVLLLLLAHSLLGATDQHPPKVLLRVDDAGMNHSTNMAIRQLAEAGMVFSTPLMTSCPWFQEAVNILKAHPQVAVGVHLTLNAEWKGYKWGPVLGREAVPSLVGPDGYFHASTQAFLDSDYQLDEVKRELDAQIRKAIDSGLNISFIDFHMRTAVATPELEQITVELAETYGLKRSMRLGETYQTLYAVAPKDKKKVFLEYISHDLDPDKTNLIINHVAVANPEMKALVDMNNPNQSDDTLPVVAIHREAELHMLLAEEFRAMIDSGTVQLVTYAD